MGGQMRKFEDYLQDGSIRKAQFIRSLSEHFLTKARDNLATMSILHQLSENSSSRSTLNVPSEYSPDEWVVICGYYAMYMAALATLAKAGYQSKSHSATICAVEELFVRHKHLEPKYARMLKSTHLKPDELQALSLAKNRREIAQYSVTKKTTKSLASKTKEDAYLFVQRMEQLLIVLEN